MTTSGSPCSPRRSRSGGPGENRSRSTARGTTSTRADAVGWTCCSNRRTYQLVVSVRADPLTAASSARRVRSATTRPARPPAARTSGYFPPAASSRPRARRGRGSGTPCGRRARRGRRPRRGRWSGRRARRSPRGPRASAASRHLEEGRRGVGVVGAAAAGRGGVAQQAVVPAVLHERGVGVVPPDEDGDLVPPPRQLVDLDEHGTGHPAAVLGRDSVGDHEQAHPPSLPDPSAPPAVPAPSPARKTLFPPSEHRF